LEVKVDDTYAELQESAGCCSQNDFCDFLGSYYLAEFSVEFTNFNPLLA
jgi:hypothetical protein